MNVNLISEILEATNINETMVNKDFKNIKVGDYVVVSSNWNSSTLTVWFNPVTKVTKKRFYQGHGNVFNIEDGSATSIEVKNAVGYITEAQLQALVTPEIQEAHDYYRSSFDKRSFQLFDGDGNPIDYSEEIKNLSPNNKVKALNFLGKRIVEEGELIKETQLTLDYANRRKAALTDLFIKNQ